MLPASPPLSPKSQQCLSTTSVPGLQEAASSLQNFASLLFTAQRAFPFFVLHSCTAWHLVNVLFPPLPPHPETGALTHRDRVRQHLLCAHPAPGIVLNSPPASLLGYKPLRPACTGAILQMRRLRLTEVYNLRR